MALSLAKFGKERDIKYFMISFTDLFGAQRAKLAPLAAMTEMQIEGAGFGGFATWLDFTPADPDIFAIPDPKSVVQLPWKPEIAWVPGNLVVNGQEIAQAPRNVLRKVIAFAAKSGLYFKTGVEAEYFLLSPDGQQISDEFDNAEKPCYDLQAISRRFDVVSEICDYMLELGWKPYQNDHEDGNGQFEMNWEYDDALMTADKHSFFKFMVKSVAEKHGFRATFMPKPFANLTGNGCHLHISAWDAAGKKAKKNFFAGKGKSQTGELGLSDKGRAFLGGILKHAAALTAIANPTVNSYKRINAPLTVSGATWSPNTATWGGNNRTNMIRIPAPGRFEVRLGDGATNPYLIQAAYIVAGLDGIKTNANPGKRYDIDMYAEGHKVTNAKKLPLNLLDALREFEKNQVLRDGLGEEFSVAYLKLKMNEWNSYMRHFTQWERDNALDV